MKQIDNKKMEERFSKIQMVKITEDFVSFETAKLLKEKGFNVPCFAYYSQYIDEWRTLKLWKRYPKTYDTVKNDGYIIVPTLQMAMKWLREVHKLSLRPRYDEVEDEKERLWYVWFFDILSMNPYKMLVEPEQGYSTYELACEVALKYCLEHLI